MYLGGRIDVAIYICVYIYTTQTEVVKNNNKGEPWCVYNEHEIFDLN